MYTTTRRMQWANSVGWTSGWDTTPGYDTLGGSRVVGGGQGDGGGGTDPAPTLPIECREHKHGMGFAMPCLVLTDLGQHVGGAESWRS